MGAISVDEIFHEALDGAVSETAKDNDDEGGSAVDCKEGVNEGVENMI